jgi:hypothetical protein
MEYFLNDSPLSNHTHNMKIAMSARMRYKKMAVENSKGII